MRREKEHTILLGQWLISLGWAKILFTASCMTQVPSGPFSLWYEYYVFELKHYLILNEGFGEMVHFFFVHLLVLTTVSSGEKRAPVHSKVYELLKTGS